MKILLVEDNETIAKGLIYSLNQNGYEIDYSSNITDANNYLNENNYNLMILDVSLPDGNGFDFFEEIKTSINIPTIFLTAKDDEDDIVKGLSLGAEDYISKPFSTRELIARINRIVSKSTNYIIKVKDISFNTDKMEVTKNGNIINLSALELKILALFFNNLNKVISRNFIIEKIWDWTGNDVNDNTVTVYLKRIREKLQTDIFITIKGIGYRVDKDEK